MNSESFPQQPEQNQGLPVESADRTIPPENAERVVITTQINPDGSKGKVSGWYIDRSVPAEPQIVGTFEEDSPSE